MRLLPLAAALILASAPYALAQSEEETVAFLLHGIEEGKLDTGGRESVVFKLVTTSPAEYRGMAVENDKQGTPQELNITVSFAKTTNQCEYTQKVLMTGFDRATQRNGENLMQRTVNLTRLDPQLMLGVEPTPRGYTFTDCSGDAGLFCAVASQPVMVLKDQLDRWNLAYAYYREEFCAGRAF